MTDEDKENTTNCRGIKDDHPCKDPLLRCEKCGNYGCSQPVTDKCTEQGFKGDKCLNCGSVGTRIPIMKDEYEKFVEAWDELNAETEIEYKKASVRMPFYYFRLSSLRCNRIKRIEFTTETKLKINIKIFVASLLMKFIALLK